MSDHPPYSFVQWALPRFHRELERPPATPEKLVQATPKPAPAPERLAEPPPGLTRLAS